MRRMMKDSYVPWLKEIPSNWDMIKGKYVLVYLQRPVKQDDEIITCFRDGEVTLRKNRREEGFTIAEKECGYQGVDIGDLVVHGMDGFAGSIGISDSRGKASPVLNVLDSTQDKKYLMYYLRALAYNNVFLALATGIRVRSCDLRWNKLAETIFLCPPLVEQVRIAAYLDAVTENIDRAIMEAKELIEKYKAYKRSVISEAVTKGLDKNAKMKDSEFQYWAKIPVQWDIKDIKYLFEIVKRIAGKEGYEILAVTQKGLKIKNISSNEGQIAENYSNYQFVYPTDYVMNHMDLLTGWVDCSTMFGVTSPDYRVFRLREKEKHCLAYYKYVLQCCYLNKMFYSLGSGVSTQGRWRLQAPVFNNFKFPVPPLSEQEQIADYLDRKCAVIDKMIEKKETLIEELQRYRKSVIYEYVTGKKQVAE